MTGECKQAGECNHTEEPTAWQMFCDVVVALCVFVLLCAAVYHGSKGDYPQASFDMLMCLFLRLGQMGK